jgi:hypothetical protein
MSSLLDTIDARLRALLTDLAAGDDVAPAFLLRLEGLCEAAVITQVCKEDAIDAIVEALHREFLGASLSERLGENWRADHPFPELPLYMQRAPVLPSTSD